MFNVSLIMQFELDTDETKSKTIIKFKQKLIVENIFPMLQFFAT